MATMMRTALPGFSSAEYNAWAAVAP